MSDLARDWAALPQISGVHASGDGRWAFWCQSGTAETDEVWGAPTDGSAPPVQLTQGEDHFLIRDVSRDGRLLVLAQSRHACERDRLILFDRASGRHADLTQAQDSHYVYGGVLSPDAGAVFFVANFDYDSGRVTEGGWVWRQDLATGKRTLLARSDAPFDAGVRMSPDGRRLLWPRNLHRPGGTQFWVMEADGTGLREVLALGENSALRGDWIDADRIAFVSEEGPSDRLGVLSLTDGSVKWLGSEPEVLAFDVVPGAGGTFAAIVHDRPWSRALVWDGAQLRPLPNQTGRRSLLPQAALPGGGWLAEAYDADAPHELVAVAADGTCRRLAPAQDKATLRRHARPRDFRWTAPDGEPVQGWLYLPQGRPKGLIAYVHGGPTWHSEDWVNPKTGFWVQSGYAVLDPNYRGSTGFGRRWREMVKQDGWGGREQLDIRSGIEAALAAGVPGPVAVAGNSYGGFSSWWQIARSPDLVAAAIPMCGMWKLDIDYAETGMPWGQSYSEEMMGGSPSEFPEKYANASPGNFVDQIRGAVLVVHGLADTNVGPENTHAAVRDMQAAGISHEVMLFPDEGHGVFRRSNVQTYLDASAAFLAGAFGTGPKT